MKPQEFELKLMTFNIEYDGTQVSFEKVVEVIQKANPNVVVEVLFCIDDNYICLGRVWFEING